MRLSFASYWPAAAAALLTFVELSPVFAVARKPAGDAGVQLGSAAESSSVYRSLGGSGHAVAFVRPDGVKFVTAVQLYAARYGMPEPPTENFHIYLLDQNKNVILGLPVAYGSIERGDLRWYSFTIPSTEVPPQFFVAVAFNPAQTKGIYLGLDERVKLSHSFVGLPNYGFQKSNQGEWMIRVKLAATAGDGRPASKSNARNRRVQPQ